MHASLIHTMTHSQDRVRIHDVKCELKTDIKTVFCLYYFKYHIISIFYNQLPQYTMSL